MTYLIALVAAALISLAVVGLMQRYAGHLGLLDQPDFDKPGARKVHSQITPRVGGWGMVAAIVVVMSTMVDWTPLSIAYVYGSLVLFVGGVIDDRAELGHYTKFIFQFGAVIPVVWFGGVVIHDFPFFGEMDLPYWVQALFTTFALLGAINALNHSDGLDGLAAGETMVSVVAIGLLAFIVGDGLLVGMSLALIGGILGFLRYNTHPARVFMGDCGSQVLGFSVGFGVIVLTQESDPNLSPAVVLLLLGLPVADILVVMYDRARSKMDLFAASKNHFHHRLLDSGLTHAESVTAIYLIQALMMALAVSLRYAPDWIIVLSYVVVCVSAYSLIGVLEKRGLSGLVGKAAPQHLPLTHGGLTPARRMLVVWPRRVLEQAIPAYIVIVSMWVEVVPFDLGVVAAVLLSLLLIVSSERESFNQMINRICAYIAVATAVYLSALDRPTWGRWWATWAETLFYFGIAVAVVMAIYFSPQRRSKEFKITTLDWLIGAMVVGALMFPEGAFMFGEFNANLFILALALMLYSTELMLVERRDRAWPMRNAILISSFILMLRGFGLIEFELHVSSSLNNLLFGHVEGL